MADFFKKSFPIYIFCKNDYFSIYLLRILRVVFLLFSIEKIAHEKWKKEKVLMHVCEYYIEDNCDVINNCFRFRMFTVYCLRFTVC